jgi:hypothetical protein
MPHKRVIRVIGIEGNAEWVDEVLRRSPLNNRLRTIFRKQGTIKEIQRVELAETEEVLNLPLRTAHRKISK